MNAERLIRNTRFERKPTRSCKALLRPDAFPYADLTVTLLPERDNFGFAWGRAVVRACFTRRLRNIGAKGNKAKLLNLFNILGFMVVGQAMGYVLGAWGGIRRSGCRQALPSCICSGSPAR